MVSCPREESTLTRDSHAACRSPGRFCFTLSVFFYVDFRSSIKDPLSADLPPEYVLKLEKGPKPGQGLYGSLRGHATGSYGLYGPYLLRDSTTGFTVCCRHSSI